ncbi:MAG: dTMP kinase [Mycoplasmataceae bacterium]|jgi:dTMP kinase|nr:dTMP kinase [Mycoplasmataceae bacterium]
MINKQGLFITFEGPDGSGKSTIIGLVYDQLKKDGYASKVVLTREPGGKNNLIAEDIRHILLNKMEYKISGRAEALLFAASRAQHVQDFIKPNLDNDKVVLCDRYIHSSLVYQGYARNLGIKEVWDVNNFGINGLLPSLTMILMVTPEQGMERIRANELREVNRLDQETMSMHHKVYEGYRKIIDENRNKTVVEIDASKTIDAVFKSVYALVIQKIKEHYGE